MLVSILASHFNDEPDTSGLVCFIDASPTLGAQVANGVSALFFSLTYLTLTVASLFRGTVSLGLTKRWDTYL